MPEYSRIILYSDEIVLEKAFGGIFGFTVIEQRTAFSVKPSFQLARIETNKYLTR